MLFRRGAAWVVDSVRFGMRSTHACSAPEGAVRLRAIVVPKLVAGSILGRCWHSLGIPFELTPLLGLPFVAAGATLLAAGVLWAGVACYCLAIAADIADGVCTGLAVNHLPADRRPAERLALRRTLDACVEDPALKFSLYGVFVAALAETGAVPGALLALLLAVEGANTLLAKSAEASARRDEFFYEFVLTAEAARRFGPCYPARVVAGHATAAHCYVLLPLLGYVAPLSSWGGLAFGLVFAQRTANLGARVATRSIHRLDRLGPVE